MLALGAGTVLPGCSSTDSAATAAAAFSAMRNRIDTHHHLFSPAYVAELDKINQAPPIVKNWSVARTLDDMDKADVATSILSITTPQVSFADTPNARRIARESNEWVAKLSQSNPGRFGSFAMLPMQDTDSALRELAYALDVLKADGIGLLTSYGDKWLGHPSFAPVMDGLNRPRPCSTPTPRWPTAAVTCCPMCSPP